MSSLNTENHNCISLCWECRTICLDTLMNYCLYEGGRHAEPAHVKQMVDCIDMCQVAADFMKRDSSLYALVCSVCKDICEACAKSCEEFRDERMQHCASVCRACAQSCRDMSNANAQAVE